MLLNCTNNLEKGLEPRVEKLLDDRLVRIVLYPKDDVFAPVVLVLPISYNALKYAVETAE